MKHISIFVTLSIFATLILGCGGDGLNRTEVSGTVTLDGKPVETGFISFKPESGTKCPDVAGEIKSGAFRIPKKTGPVPGAYTVNILASEPTGRKVKAPMTGIESDEMKQIIPPPYTGIMGKSVLTSTIAEGKNELTFELKN